MPPGVLFGQFWAPASECPKECFLSAFWRFLGLKNAKKHSKSTLWGTPRQVPKIAQKALQGALSGPGPKSTPVNGGRDRNQKRQKVSNIFFRRFSTISPRHQFSGPFWGDLISALLWGPNDCTLLHGASERIHKPTYLHENHRFSSGCHLLFKEMRPVSETARRQ